MASKLSHWFMSAALITSLGFVILGGWSYVLTRNLPKWMSLLGLLGPLGIAILLLQSRGTEEQLP